MTTRKRRLLAFAVPGLLLLASTVLIPAVALPAMAQGADLSGIGETTTTNIRATVAAIDQATRKVTLTNAEGKTVTITAGPEFQNLAQVKPGDVVLARQITSVTYVLSPHGSKTPPDQAALARVRAEPGEMPAGGVGSEAIVTGVVVGVDQAAKTISLVDPSGGLIRTINVRNPRAQTNLQFIRPGDRITAIFRDIIVGLVQAPGA
jgi:Cu/Ag efflux protein CusF